MKMIFSFIVFALCTLSAMAEEVEIDGLLYELDLNEYSATVHKKNRKHSGDIVIPSTISYNGVQYSVTDIGEYAFENCTAITSISIPNSVINIGSSAFSGCSMLQNIEIPNSVINIGSSAFESCSGLRNLVVPNTENIKDRTFCGCSSLETIVFPENLKKIGADAFHGCSSLKSLSLPESLESIGSYAFENCIGLESVDFPENVESVGSGVFYGCTQLKNTIIRNGNLIFVPYDAEGEYTIPDDVTRIVANAFLKHKGLTLIRIPDSVITIDGFNFGGCDNLECIIIGKGVKTIGPLAFESTPKLKKMICYLTKLPAVGEMLFDYSGYTEGTLYVPQECLSMYNAAFPWYGWGEIKAIEEMKPEGDGDNACEAPVISFENSALSITSSTPNSKCYYTIEDNDIKTDKLVTNPIELSATYKITAYAVAEGYSQSSVTTATLVWLTAKLEQNVPTSAKAIEVPSIPVLISSNGGMLTVTGMEEGTEVSAFSADGKKIDSAYSTSNTVTLNASSLQGNIAVVKVGDKSVKVMVK